MDQKEIDAAKDRVARRAELRRQAAERGMALPDNYRQSLRNQFEQGMREAQLITRLNQGRSLHE